MLRDPGHSFVDGVDGRSRSDHGTTDHVNLQPELARSLDLGVGGVATGVLRQYALDAMLAKEGGIVLRSERTARGDDRCVRKAGRRCDRVNYADDVVMLRSRAKRSKRTPAQRGEYSLRSFGKCRDCGFDGRMLIPIVVNRLAPFRTFDGEQGNAGCGSGCDRVVADLRRERMRRIDDESDRFRASDIRQGRRHRRSHQCEPEEDWRRG